MNIKLSPFVNVMQRLRGSIQERQRIAAIAIGYACACNSNLPSSAVEDAAEHYAMNVEAFAKRVISTMNEVSVIDTTLALEFSRKFWLLRYEAVHKCPRMDSVPGDFFASVFGVPKFFSPETTAFANTHANDIATVYQHICNVIAENFTEV
jgi:hypothetical protein